MKLACFVIICGVVLLTRPLPSQRTSEPRSVEKSKQELLDLENHWLQVEDDPAALELILAPDFLHVVPAGIITRDEQLSFMRKHPRSEQGAKLFENLHVRVYGDVGIVNGAVVAAGQEGAAKSGQGARKTLFTDVFVYRDGTWQAVSAQELPVATR
jgi:Domain of unknown function (DUF4440)